nr:hypothetical protein AVEN_249561-1 [Araneus ventricosus]
MNRDITLDTLEAAKNLRLPDLQQACSEFLESSDHQQTCSEFSSSSIEQDQAALFDRDQDENLKRRVLHLILDAIASAFF